MAKIRCRFCMNLDYNYIFDRHDPQPDGQHVCGLHGGSPVDPDGEQVDFDHNGGCGFIPKRKTVQLTFDFGNNDS